MKAQSRNILLYGCAAILGLALVSYEVAEGRGGGGGGRAGGGGGGPSGGRPGGGGGAGGGGGGARPSTPGSRPNAGSAPSFGASPGAGNTRPSTGSSGGTRPASPSAGRPPISTGSANGRPGGSERPQSGTRPSIETRPNVDNGLPGNRTGNVTRPANDGRPGTAVRPGADRPATLPGLGNRDPVAANRLPNANNRLPNSGNRLPNGGANTQDRHNDLQNRLQGGSNLQNNRQDWRDNNREDWQNWANNNHGDWHHGYAGGGAWDHMWNEHPGWMAFGMTTWGVNRLAYGFGLASYANPYYNASAGSTVVYNYSQPIIQQPASTDSAEGAAAGTQVADGNPSPFDQARTDFYGGDYASALNNINQTLKQFPDDAVAHEFRSLILFALGRFNESASTIHPVLAVGPGWDWPTLVSLYPSVDVYTGQLRTLEEFTKSNPKAADASFLLAYHYLTCDHKDAAHKLFEKVVGLQPSDTIAAEYARLTDTEPAKDSAAPSPQPAAASSIPADQLLSDKDILGKWKATGANGTSFVLELTDKNEFTWSFSQGKTSQSVKGVFALDQNTLAMQPDTGGTMLADLSKKATGIHFVMQGSAPNDPGLDFTK